MTLPFDVNRKKDFLKNILGFGQDSNHRVEGLAGPCLTRSLNAAWGMV